MITTTQAICMDTPGPARVMQLREVPLPAPQKDQVQIQHHAIGLNYIDIYQRSGAYALPLPAQLGMEGAGIVLAVGEDVEHLQPGDRVAYTSQPPGSYSHHRTMPAQNVCVLPDSIDFDTGAAMMLKGLTAQYLLRKTLPAAGLHPGDFVLFHAAAGGVGLIACQWAKALGLQLIGTAGSDEKCALATSYGATHTINYRTQDFVAEVRTITQGRGVKVVYDSVGQDTFDASLDCLQPFGLMVSFGNASGPIPPFQIATLAAKGSLYLTRPTLFTHLASRQATQAMVDDLLKMVLSGYIKIPVTQRFALADVARAHEALEARQTAGALVLHP